jgi:uncharacterized membrane protein
LESARVDEKGTKMRILGAVLAIALLLSPVHAQNAGGMGGGMGGGKGGGKARTSQNSDQQKVDQQKKKAAEDAYKAGLKMIPDAKQKYDPWKNAR